MTPAQRRAKKHEEEVARDFGGELTPMSGAGWVAKQDVQTSIEIIECKDTAAMSYTVKRELMQEVVRQGLLAGKRPLLHIKIEPSQFQTVRYVAMTEDDYLALSQKAGER